MPKITPHIRPARSGFRRRHLLLALAGVGAGVLIGQRAHGPGDVERRSARQPEAVLVDGRFARQPAVEGGRTPAIAASGASPAVKVKATPGNAVPITLSASPAMFVGDMGELVISTRTSRPIRSISFHMRVDANVLTLQDGSAGDWLARGSSPNPFVVEISPGQDQIWVRSDAGESRPDGGSGSIAVVRLQAMAPGDAVVTIDDLRIIDDSGATLAFTCSPSQVNVKVANPVQT
jgi:hypothetical protein